MDFLFIFVVLTLLGLIFFSKQSRTQTAPNKEDVFPYFKIPAELSFYHVLKVAVSEEYDIFAKVRLADLISVNKGMDRAEWGKAFNKIKAKHIDFILCHKNTSEIICAIELDDQSHSQTKRQQRDEFVTKALEVTKIPFVRFDVIRTYQSEVVKNLIRSTVTPNVLEEAMTSTFDNILIDPDVEQSNLVNDTKCPKCGGDLVLRKVARGQKKGREFFGCSNFPQCRHMSEAS